MHLGSERNSITQKKSLKSIPLILSNPFKTKSMTLKNVSKKMKKPSVLLILVVFTVIVQLSIGFQSKVKVVQQSRETASMVTNLQSIARFASLDCIIYDSCIVTTPTDTTRQIRFVRASLSLRDTTLSTDTLRAVRVDTAVSVTYDPKPIAVQSIKKREPAAMRSMKRILRPIFIIFFLFLLLL
jgi:hypothetical protein